MHCSILFCFCIFYLFFFFFSSRRRHTRSLRDWSSDVSLPISRQLIDGLVGEFEPEALHSEYRQNLRELLEAKLTGEEIAKPEPVPEAPVIDLLEALKQSVAATKPRGDGAKPAERKKAAPRKRAAARK